MDDKDEKNQYHHSEAVMSAEDSDTTPFLR